MQNKSKSNKKDKTVASLQSQEEVVCYWFYRFSVKMKIVIDNVSDGDAIPHRLLLVRGRVENLDSSVLDGKNI